MRFGKLSLSRLGVVEAEQGHPQIVVRVGVRRIEAHSFAVADGGVLIFPGVEQSAAEIESHIGIIWLQWNDFLVGSDGSLKFVGCQLAGAQADKRLYVVRLQCVRLFIVGRCLGVVLLLVVRTRQIVEGIKLIRLKREALLVRVDSVAEFAELGHYPTGQ